MSRKRRYFKTFFAQDDGKQIPHDTEGSCSHESGSEKDDAKKLEMEMEIWDAFREEYYEAIEQLPLSLHRQFNLMKELDQQAHGFHSDLSMTLQEYISLHQSMVTTPRTPTTMSSPTEHVRSSLTQEMLSRIGHLAEELLRASEEKVNLAQAGYDSVDRHIRLLDQAIKEQEVSISSGIRPGTHLAPILLPDLIVPRWARPSRVTHSPMPTTCGATDGENEEENLAPNVSHGRPTPIDLPPEGPDEPRVHLQKKGKKGSGKWTRKKVEREYYIPEHPRRGVRSLKLTVPTPAHPAIPPPGLVVDPNEPRYCYCNQVSFGEMIACDGKGCKGEWFHWDCVGLKKAPGNKSKWYCRNCSR